MTYASGGGTGSGAVKQSPRSLVLVVLWLQFDGSQPDVLAVWVRLKRQRQNASSVHHVALYSKQTHKFHVFFRWYWESRSSPLLFKCTLELDGSPWYSLTICSGMEQMARVHNMQDAFPVTELTTSKHWRNVLIPLASSFPMVSTNPSKQQPPGYDSITSESDNNTTTIVLRPFVRDYPGKPVPEETLTHPSSWTPSNLYQLLPSTTIHIILPVQITSLAIFLHNLSPCPLWSTSWSGALHLIFHTFLYPISVFFSHHMPIPSQPVLL